MKYIFYLLLLPSLIFSSPKREFRAMWIASVFNIDWPSQSGLPKQQQKEELIKILDKAEELKFNAVILQIKPTSDAFYKSKHSPWSRYLMGTQGKDPQYDPLEFFIEEAHKRNLETHLWINPFRILNGESWDTLSPKHIARKNEDWVIKYNNRYYFDPGNPEVQKYIIKEISEIIKNYDLDVLHMDDYFYPYKAYSQGNVIPFKDDTTWKQYGKKFASREDWRRDNINNFIQKVNTAIKKEKSYVQFGISPFGVWRNKSVDPKGSKTQAGQTNYDDLYADVLAWLENKWIDYILPQLYWHTDTVAAPYDVLVRWWDKHTPTDIPLYIGLGLYKLQENNWPVTHIQEQVAYARKYKNIQGFSSYSAKWIMQNIKGIQESFRTNIHTNFAIVPRNMNLKDIKPYQPIDFKLANNMLTWNNGDKEWTRYFIIYRFEKNKKPDIEKSENIIGIVSAKKPLRFIVKYDKNATYGITAVSRLHQESTLLTLEDNEKLESLDILDEIISTNK